MQFGEWHGRPAREITRKMRVPQFKLHHYQMVTSLSSGKVVMLSCGLAHRFRCGAAPRRYMKVKHPRLE
jgi:hypothetical protein